MNKTLISKFSFILLAALAVTFTGCNKDDNDDDNDNSVGTSVIAGNKITATVSGVGDRVVDYVRVEYYHSENETENDYGDTEVLAEAEFKDNKFSIELPATLRPSLLWDIAEELEIEDTDIKISNPNAKALMIDFDAYRADYDYRVGMFWYGNDDDDEYIDMEVIYVDSDVTVTGTWKNEYGDKSFTERFNCNFKKGWNYFAQVYVGDDKDGYPIYEMSTSIPSGAKWEFISNYYKSADASPKRAKK